MQASDGGVDVCSSATDKCCKTYENDECVAGAEFDCFKNQEMPVGNGSCSCLMNCSSHQFCWNYDKNCGEYICEDEGSCCDLDSDGKAYNCTIDTPDVCNYDNTTQSIVEYCDCPQNCAHFRFCFTYLRSNCAKSTTIKSTTIANTTTSTLNSDDQYYCDEESNITNTTTTINITDTTTTINITPDELNTTNSTTIDTTTISKTITETTISNTTTISSTVTETITTVSTESSNKSTGNSPSATAPTTVVQSQSTSTTLSTTIKPDNEVNCNDKECDDMIEDFFNQTETFTLSTPITKMLSLVDSVNKTLNSTDSVQSAESLTKTIEIIDRIQYLLNGKSEPLTEETAEKYTTNVVNIFSNLIDKEDAWSNASDDQKNELSSKILLNLHYSAFTYGCSVRDKNSTSEKILSNTNIAVKTYNTFFDQSVTFTSEKENFDYIELPAGIKTESVNNSRCNNTAFGAIVYNIADHMPGNDSEFSNREEYEINSNVLSFAVTDSKDVFRFNDGLTTRVSFENKNLLEFGDNSVCVYWDFSNSKWSDDGCTINEELSTRDVTVCECTHLSYFGVSVDKRERESNLQTFFLVNYVCTCVALLGLIITIPILIVSYRKVGEAVGNQLEERVGVEVVDRTKKRSVIMLNICVLLILVNIITVLRLYKREGVKTDHTVKNEISSRCAIISSFLLYFLLSTLLWILHEAYDVFFAALGRDLKFMTDLERNTCCYVTFFILIGYAIPAFLVLMALVIELQRTNTVQSQQYFCGLAFKDDFWFLVIMCAVVFICILTIIAKKIHYFSTNKLKVKKRNYLRYQLIEFAYSCTIFLTMVIAWAFYLLYINRYGMAYIYAFIVINGYQGVLICGFEICKVYNLLPRNGNSDLENQNNTAIDDNNQNNTAIDDNNQNITAIDDNNQNNTAIDDNNQNNTAIDDNNQNNTAIDDNNQNNTAIDDNNQNNSAIDDNNQNNTAIDDNNQNNTAIDDNNQNNTAIDDNNQNNSAIDDNNQNNSAIDDNNQNNTAIDDNNQNNTTIDDNNQNNTTIDDNNKNNTTIDDNNQTNTTIDDNNKNNTTIDDNNQTNTTIDDNNQNNTTIDDNNQNNTTIDDNNRNNTAIDDNNQNNTALDGVYQNDENICTRL